MIKILDFLINALVLWRSKIAIKNQIADLSQLDGKADAQTAGFQPVKRFDWLSDVEALKRIEDDVLADIPNWEQAPKWANWYAVDSDGSGSFFENKPRHDRYTWRSTSGDWCYANAKVLTGSDWKDSLRQRPESAPVYFPGLTEQEIKDLQKKQNGINPC